MTLFRAWLQARPHQDFDLIVKILGAIATGLVKDWMLIAQSLILKMIRGGSDCFTLALCTFNGDDEAHSQSETSPPRRFYASWSRCIGRNELGLRYLRKRTCLSIYFHDKGNAMRYCVSTMLAIIIGTVSPAWCYEVIAVSDGGTLTGTVRLEGQIPKPKGYNLTTLPDPYYCGRISDGRGWRILQPFNIGPGGKFRDVLVYLEGVKKGKPFEDGGVLQVEAKDCLFLPFTTVVRDNKSVTVVNMDPVMHDIQAYETSHLGARVLFNVPLPMNQHHPRNFRDRSDAALYHKHMAGAPKKELVMLSKDRRIFVMQCGFHAYMESWGLAVRNPYFAKTDEQGRFTITDVPPGTYKLVVWHPYIRTVNEQAVTIGPNGTTEADFAVLAPTGRLYVNEALEHDSVRYSATEEQKKEIEPMVHTQAH